MQITRERLQKATYLLRHSSMLVKEIAYACGIASFQYFCHLFTKVTGCSPQAYRRQSVLLKNFSYHSTRLTNTPACISPITQGTTKFRNRVSAPADTRVGPRVCRAG
ncbi:MAG: helix-turn-helix domain-containing protein [Lentisphaerae bacterium]|nr:helix-turn-helix domain-containing protein [Lentisphaerota bacterium]